MFNCHEMQKMTSEYLDKRLSFVKRLEFRLHTFMCHDCRRFTEQFRATLMVLRKLPPTKPSAETIDAQVERLLKQRSHKP